MLVDPRSIIVEKQFNPRIFQLKEHQESLEDLVRSIKTVGIIDPLKVRVDNSGNRILVDGERRLRAVLALREEGHIIAKVPTLIVAGNSESERLLTAIHANETRRITKFEYGESFKRLEKFGWSLDEIAEKTGQTPRFVREAMEIVDVPEEIKAMLAEGSVSEALVLHETRNSDPEEAVANLQEAAETAKETGTSAKRYKSKSVSLKRLVIGLLADISEEDLRGSGELIPVSRKKINQLSKILNF